MLKAVGHLRRIWTFIRHKRLSSPRAFYRDAGQKQAHVMEAGDIPKTCLSEMAFVDPVKANSCGSSHWVRLWANFDYEQALDTLLPILIA